MLNTVELIIMEADLTFNGRGITYICRSCVDTV